MVLREVVGVGRRRRGVLRPQLELPRRARPRPSGEPQPDADVAVQQLQGRAVGGATFEAMPISGLKNAW